MFICLGSSCVSVFVLLLLLLLLVDVVYWFVATVSHERVFIRLLFTSSLPTMLNFFRFVSSFLAAVAGFRSYKYIILEHVIC